jgi:hypothetical protein
MLIIAALATLVGGCAVNTPPTATYSLPTPNRAAAGQAGPAVLGAADTAFIAAFGQPVNEFGAPDSHPGNVLAFDNYPNTFVNGVIAERDLADAHHLRRIVIVLLAAPPDQLWSWATAQTNCLAFAPADAHFQQQAAIQDAQGWSGRDMIYSSATLAHTFPASAFLDDDSNPVTAGIFNIQYTFPSASQSDQVVSCQLALGTRQANFT